MHRIADQKSPIGHSEIRLALRRAARAKGGRPKQVLGLTAELRKPILAACPASLAGRRDAAPISVGYDTLSRSSELSAVRTQHLSDDLRTLRIPRSKSDQLGDGRLAYLSPNTQTLLASWLEASGLADGPLFRACIPESCGSGRSQPPQSGISSNGLRGAQIWMPMSRVSYPGIQCG